MSLVELGSIVERHVRAFSEKRRTKIEVLSLPKLLMTKNPYLFIARQVNTPADLAEQLVTAALSSSEETMFGNTLEKIAIDICAAAYNGQKSTATGVDLEFFRGGRRYVVAIKSGPNWGNSSQIARLKQNLAGAVRLIRQHDPEANVMAVNGCCYGRGDHDYGTYRKVCGAAFWELISGDTQMYTRLIDPLREAASNGFVSERNRLIERLAVQLAVEWSRPDGYLDWERIVDLSASLYEPLTRRS